MVLGSDLVAPWVFFRPISFVLYIAVDSVGDEADGTKQSGGRRLGR
jgi:hypothetical protein